MKKILVSFAVIAIVGGCIYWWLNSETTLVDLQKAYLLAESDKEREEVIDRLEAYYLNLDVPDSIRQHVDDEVASLLETTEIDPAAYAQDQWDTTNVYRLENQLRDLIKTAMIARAREEASLFRELMGVAREMAESVDEGTGVDYWVRFVDEKSGVTKEKAIAWLRAERAARLCYKYYFSERWKDAEWYGSIGLKHIGVINDIRLKLDVLQRLQFMLYYFRGLYELSVGLADESVKKSDEINYILRSQAIAYYQADALFENGRIVEALDSFQKLKNNAESFSQVPFIAWYFKKSMIRIADCYRRLSQLHKGLSILKKLEDYELNSSDEIVRHISTGLINLDLGKYSKAEFEFRKALAIADSIVDFPNQVRILNNIGFLFSELTEYDKALKYYNQAQTLVEEYFPEASADKINLFLDLARVKQKQKEMNAVASLVNDANDLLRRPGALPKRKAQMLISLGTLRFEIGQNVEAFKTFHEAEFVCQTYGLTRLGLESKLRLAESMMRLRKYSKARDKIYETIEKAKQYGKLERIIDSLALLAEIEHKEGNLVKALDISNGLVNEIETVIRQGFEDSKRLISYHQKIYDYLKNVVTYEILLGRLDDAFTKLDYAKSISLHYHVPMDNGVYNHNVANSGSHYVDGLKSQIGKDRLLMNVMLTNEKLYVFTLNSDGLQLFRKEIDSDSLRKTVNAYVDTLHNTVEVFNRYNVNTIDNHFKSTTQLGHRLFQELMGWPELRTILEKVNVIYLIPDEFLYKIPFATLVVNDSEPISYLVHKVDVVNLQSASFLVSQNAMLQESDMNNLRALISADPNFQEMDSFVSDLKKSIPVSKIMTIEKDEVQKEEVIEKLSENFDVYVFSGHSVANPVDPELSYIDVFVRNSSGANSKKFKIKLSDLRALKWSSPTLVLLVGCETASGKLYRGSGFLGLQNLLLSQGAQNVLASLWKIDAAQAIPQTRDYLHLYLESFNPSLALRKTQIKAINYLNNHTYYRNPHPYFWGANILYSKYLTSN